MAFSRTGDEAEMQILALQRDNMKQALLRIRKVCQDSRVRAIINHALKRNSDIYESLNGITEF